MSRAVTSQDLDAILDYLHKGAEKFGRIENQLLQVQENMKAVRMIITDGQPNLSQQVAQCQVSLQSAKDDLEDLQESLRGITSHASARRMKRWELWVAVSMCVIAAIATVVAAWLGRK